MEAKGWPPRQNSLGTALMTQDKFPLARTYFQFELKKLARL